MEDPEGTDDECECFVHFILAEGDSVENVK